MIRRPVGYVSCGIGWQSDRQNLYLGLNMRGLDLEYKSCVTEITLAELQVYELGVKRSDYASGNSLTFASFRIHPEFGGYKKGIL